MVDFIEIPLLKDLNFVSILIRIVIAIILGGMLGIERGRKNSAAGLRTHVLVCLGAAMVMMTNQYVVSRYGGDPTRLGAQVISGIGFLGAGTILVTRRNQIRGLTTAAGLWTSACLGLAIGIGFYEGALLVGLTMFLVLAVFQRVSERLQNNSRYMHIYISFRSLEFFDEFLGYVQKQGVVVQDLELGTNRVDRKGSVSFMLNLKHPERNHRTQFIEEIGQLPGVNRVVEL